VADAEGRFRIEGLRPGAYAVNGSAGGHGAKTPVEASAPGSGVRVVLRRAGRLRLRLVAPPGAPPVAQVEIAVEDLPDGGGMGFSQAWKAGEVEIDGLTSERVRVGIAVSGYAPVFREEAVSPGETRDLGAVSLDAGVVLLGRVLDEAGRPRACARVRVQFPGTLDDSVATTDADGRFRVERLPDREHFVRLEAEGCVPGAEHVRPSREPVTFTLVRGVRVRGVVRWTSGAAPEAAFVVFLLQGESPLGVPRRRYESLDDSGRFEVLVAPGTHLVRIEGLGDEVIHEHGPVGAPSDSPLTIDVP
jgi:hypothetical protein